MCMARCAWSSCMPQSGLLQDTAPAAPARHTDCPGLESTSPRAGAVPPSPDCSPMASRYSPKTLVLFSYRGLVCLAGAAACMGGVGMIKVGWNRWGKRLLLHHVPCPCPAELVPPSFQPALEPARTTPNPSSDQTLRVAAIALSGFTGHACSAAVAASIDHSILCWWLLGGQRAAGCSP